MATTSAAARHLDTVITHWPDLYGILGTRTPATWPPAARMSEFITSLAELDTATAEATRARARYLRTQERDPGQIGASDPPLRIALLDVMHPLESGLLRMADAVAQAVQRPAYTASTGRGWTDPIHREMSMLAVRDAADPQRWRPDLLRTRNAVAAATWLRARAEGHPGPVRPLPEELRRHLTTVARSAAAAVDRALDLADRTAQLVRPCPLCGGRIDVQGGGGVDPTARCRRCGHTWATPPATTE
ncbi:hypothetical protein [Streptomyces sp. SID3212]|uniref:hypothetical protein n=1 Tax=Streptomyces sp. SID3212 TaxID=2690259 RepID=UPI00136F15D6|nr:hypothetical protein [Streptomyces sp. SID3212]MYV56466.1 hypothetical protein [Streptomyces sp. SID3212]